MAFEFLSKNKLNNVARAIYDLRVGLPVIIDASYLIFACETLGFETFQDIKASGNELFISTILADGRSSMVKLSEKIEFADLLVAEKILSEKPVSSSLISATKLLKIAELMPVYLMSQINNIIPGISSLSSQDLSEYINHISSHVSLIAEARLQLRNIKSAQILSFRSEFALYDHYAIVVGDLKNIEVPNVRIHSSCFTGDLLNSLSCDCHDQLMTTLEYLNDDNPGIVVYLMQEGRGIGLTNKIRSYKLQSLGCDTVEANEELGFNCDEREFGLAAAILKNIGIHKINLLTNNRDKVLSLEKNGIKVISTVSINGHVNIHNKSYLETKKLKMGHKVEV
jgi:GTP cyclohydrolase II